MAWDTGNCTCATSIIQTK